MQTTSAESQACPEGKFEVYAWFFMRVSGLLLAFLAVGHLFVMHVVTGIDNIDYDFVMERFKTPFWRSYDFLMLFLAMLHGTNGVRILIGDYIQDRGKRLFVISLLFIVSFIVLLLGAMVLI